MKILVYALIGLVVLLIELGVTNHFLIFGVTIDLLLIFTILMSQKTDFKTNIFVALILGGIKDIIVSTVFGVNIVIMALTVFLIRSAKDKIYENRIWTPIVMITLGTIGNTLVYYLASLVFYNGVLISGLFIVTFKSIILNLIISLFIRTPFMKLFNQL